MKRIQLGPFNRVEGDLEVGLDVEAGQVVAAQVNSPLFRGFEQILVGRLAEDSLAIVPRICGICSVAQSAAAAAALADLAGVTPPANGVLVQRLILATENLADHLTHFYLFFMPDFARPAYAGRPWYDQTAARFMAVKGQASGPALQARARFFHLIGLLAGRWPHTLAIQPGGSSKAMTAAERTRVLAVLREFRAFLEGALLGDRLENFAALADGQALQAWAAGRSADFPLFLRAATDLALERTGRATDRFLSYGAYGLFASGLWQPDRAPDEGILDQLDPAKITEDTRHAWLAESPPYPPARGETVVNAEKAGAYTWCKAPRYAGQVVETGALARQLVAGNPLARDLVASHGGSVTVRIVARMIELATVLPAMEQWVRAIVPGEAFCQPAPLPESGEGVGLVEAARGGLGHWLSVKRGRIERYQIIAPTTWNFSPRDRAGQPGPLEQALIGLPAGDGALPTVQHVVRSFDPCMVCTVH
ncbi:nickel-dependent hydrogenase large subunit [Dechloromonas denitrificans]|uniref:nickel-dependent hydrogenase large subunit n=1 Tax=Dechloromonas denitrificans TaxID=281362 RepID=UPI001CF87C26|nr:nickel-dependent hydrogenase large subunit [Dechloromonas denitrificans]UCV03494.1 nickel-dependent hydrogenase large subunit [Dechloromonas denitrificans]